jgi:hypothetical protein
MASVSKPVARVRYNLPAGLIMTPRELKQYHRWQRSYTTLKPIECGILPTAIEYEEFQQWLKKQDSGYFSDVFDDIQEHIRPTIPSSEPTIASLCLHTLHPVATGQPRLRCPVCIIDIHLNYMKVLMRALHSANGRPLPCTGTPSEQQENLYLAWSQGKISALRQVSELEKMSTEEDEWAEQHPNGLCKDVHSATKALELYWYETTECQGTKPCSTKKHRVVFADDTNFLPGRPADYFLRRSPRYEPGKYTLTEGTCEDDEDISEDSEDYSCARILVVGGPEESSDFVTMRTLGESVHIESPPESLEDDDGDSNWEDVDSDEDDVESNESSFICFEADEEESYIVFSDD